MHGMVVFSSLNGEETQFCPFFRNLIKNPEVTLEHLGAYKLKFPILSKVDKLRGPK